jgi:hypothetical protein
MIRRLGWQHAPRAIVCFVAIVNPVVAITIDVAHDPTAVDASTSDV